MEKKWHWGSLQWWPVAEQGAIATNRNTGEPLWTQEKKEKITYLLLLTYYKKFFLSDTTLTSFNSNWSSAFHVCSLYISNTVVLSSHEVQLHFQRSCNFVLLLSSMRSSLLSQAGLLPQLLDLRHSEIACSHGSKKYFLKTDQHSWTPKPSKTDSQGTQINLIISWSPWPRQPPTIAFPLSPSLFTKNMS